jgi:mono/diheme cytochrome c family protein
MRFLRDAIITLVVLVVVLIVIVYARTIRAGGLSADAEPGSVERAVATRLVQLSIPAGAQQQQNPFEASADTWRTAADHYADHCMICHGADGRGHTEIGEHMYPNVPDLADPSVQKLSDGSLFFIIQNGVRWTGMPAWKEEHTPEDTWRLVSFMRKIPTLTPDEVKSIGGESEGHEHHEHSHEGPHGAR